MKYSFSIIKSQSSLYLLVLLTFLFNPKIYSQTDSTQLSTEEIIKEMLQEPATESDNEDIYEILEDLSLNPIDINSADISELQRIPGLTIFYASLIIEHRKKFGSFFSLNEMNLIEGLPKVLIEKAKPFLTIVVEKYNEDLSQELTSGKTFANIFDNIKLNFRSRVMNDLQERRGFSENKYEGSRPKIYNRVLLKYDNLIEAGLVAEKDAGEKSLNDFTSFHVALKNYEFIKTFVLGDYTLEFGQGLALWSPFAFSKGADAIYPLKRKGKPINPFKSTNENNFFRGAASSIRLNNFFMVSSFYSNNFFDANIDSISRSILSIPIDGFHRTETEIRKRKSAREIMYGGRIDYKNESENINTGVLYYTSMFSSSFLQESPFDLNGDKFNYYSIYYDLYFGKINLFGESAFDERSIASLISASFSIDKNFSFITSVRSYPRNYRNIHSYAFGEKSGNTQNEFGIYTGFQWRNLLGEINFYFDQFKLPYATFENPMPTNGNEFLFDLRSKPLSKVETNLRFKYEKKEITKKINNLESIVPQIRQALRGEVIFETSKQLRLRTRIEFNNYTIPKMNVNEIGMMVFQDVRFSPAQSLSFDGRIILFQTDSFNSAIYGYENDLAGILSNVALYGKGVRWYFLVKYKPIRNMSLSAKYSEMYKPLEKDLGSGFSEIKNNLDNRIHIQVEIIF